MLPCRRRSCVAEISFDPEVCAKVIRFAVPASDGEDAAIREAAASNSAHFMVQGIGLLGTMNQRRGVGVVQP